MIKKINEINAVFAGCARDCEQYVQKTLDNINYYSILFKNSFNVIVENGSKDKTREILIKNKTHKNYYLFEDSLNKLKHRGQRLEKARNIIIEKIKSTPILSNCEILIILDLDSSGNYRINKDDLHRAIDFLFSNESIAAVFANQLGTYYDMWTLRDNVYCKNDFWADILKCICQEVKPNEIISNEIFSKIKKDYVDKKTFSFAKDLAPIKVKSAFGGFGIYKMKYVLNNKRKYEGTQKIIISFKDKSEFQIDYQRCEHVNFNLGFVDENLDLFILPYLINQEFMNVTFPPEAAIKLIIKD